MKSAISKVVHPLAGRPLIEHVVATAATLDASTTTVVVGHGADDVRLALSAYGRVGFVVQSPQLGTGHALLQAESALSDARGTVLLLYGDVPLLRSDTLRQLLEHHRQNGAVLTVLTATLHDPYGYGRIVRDPAGRLTRIVEERDASADERTIAEVNSGIYAIELDGLFRDLRNLAADNAQGEYYLTDLVSSNHQRGRRIETVTVGDPLELRGVNTRVDLAELGTAMFDRTRRSLMLQGVTLEDPATAYIGADVIVGEDTVISPNVTISGRSTIGARCRIHSGARIVDSVLGDEVTVLDHTIVVESSIAHGAAVGPMAHLRPSSSVGARARVGNFVELKKTVLGAGSKANHLAYLGDATIGERVNVGAGVITCNYDGFVKHQTTIEDQVFVGSDSQLIAPVTIGEGAYVAAGSTVTQNVPAGALAVGRAQQVNKDGWAARRAEARQKDRAR